MDILKRNVGQLPRQAQHTGIMYTVCSRRLDWMNICFIHYVTMFILWLGLKEGGFSQSSYFKSMCSTKITVASVFVLCNLLVYRKSYFIICSPTHTTHSTCSYLYGSYTASSKMCEAVRECVWNNVTSRCIVFLLLSSKHSMLPRKAHNCSPLCADWGDGVSGTSTPPLSPGLFFPAHCGVP